MTPRSRLAVTTGVATTTLLALTACGSIAADSPTDASLEGFCTASAAIDRTAGDFAAGLAETGTPAGVSEQVRDGFEIYVDALDDKGDEAYDEARNTLAVPRDDVADGDAFISYMTDTCEQYFADRAVAGGDASAP
ncbi:hypothetical protein FE634_09215 [Nocardioides dongxiaopingii]|uniref:hypothetical protein n=1 Tax=Nocardioides sp. S-1144 TaxID=2582905 RepID=UPI00110F5324|nr:hypothetical protein [Nocardioides sp. S-1144]QCW50545.1 hypothetical protein FE634_09215 [Nocardioides sp. S-1144]